MYKDLCRRHYEIVLMGGVDNWRANKADQSRRSRLQARLKAIEAYGGKCACCGENEIKFLSLDHINGGGSVDRIIHKGGSVFYRYLRRQGWPAGYQVLCHNCNLAKGFYGECPHANAS